MKKVWTHPVKFFNCLFKNLNVTSEKLLCELFLNIWYCTVDQWVIFERYIVWWFFDWEKKILYILYCLLWRPYRTLGDFARFFFFSLLNDRFDKKRTHWTVRTCEKMQNFRIIAVSSWWIETGDYFECKWSSMIIEWKKVNLKVSNLR